MDNNANTKKYLFALIGLFLVLTSLLITPPKLMAATTTVDLGTADGFAILAGSAIPNTNPSAVIGDVGLSPSTGAGIGLTCLEVTGTIYTVAAAGPLPCRVPNAGVLTQAKNDLTTAYSNAAARIAGPDIGTELAGATLTDGVYHAASGTFEISAGGTLTLDGGGSADSVFIFKMGSSLTTLANSNVILRNGAQACNVFWQVGTSATLGTGTNFVGTILADQAITDSGGSTVNGRFLASVAAVTLNDTTITSPSCAASPSSTSIPTSSSSSSNSTGSGNSGSSDGPCPAITYSEPIITESKRIDADSILIGWGAFLGAETFNVQYGLANGEWLYSTNVTGNSITINGLPSNTPVWVKVAVRSSCTVGIYSESKLVGGPRLPAAGFAPLGHNHWFNSWSIKTSPSFLLNLMNYSAVNYGVSLRASSSVNHSSPQQAARYSGSRIND